MDRLDATPGGLRQRRDAVCHGARMSRWMSPWITYN